MVRGKTQMRRIENATSRQVTFSKRRNGLLKKAFELSVLCDAEVALIIFSPRGKLYEFASSSMHETIERYQKHAKEIQATNLSVEQNTQHLKHEAASMMKRIEQLEASKRKLLGEGLGTCSIEELQQLERQLERSVNVIRARKERALAAENALLCEKFGIEAQRRESKDERVIGTSAEISEISDVETDLFIGLPEMRNKRTFPK
ncbi:MADS-box transcription factor [Striga asiatica]|uniref:MADS-box transcription factor n=1 Tax=Striga asiatica TaxID=4170 RepID=A0A5A7PE95_STRAF|nr:MADS-box transcription factor [Striga asiatica]